MKKMQRVFELLAIALVSFTLSGCLEVASLAVGGADIAMSGGPLFDRPLSDADTLTATLASKMPFGAFVEKSRAVALDLGYQVQATDGHGLIVRKQSESLAGALIGRDWQYTLTINLNEDGKTVRIDATTHGNNHKADPGSAKKIAEEFKAHFVPQYASQ